MATEWTVFSHHGDNAMSARTDQILDVLTEIWSRRPAIAMFRVDAEKAVAAKRGKKTPTIHDKLVRQLPAIRNTKDLDRRIMRWLGGDPAPLRSAVVSASSNAERQRVEQFFERNAWPLSNEEL